MSSPLTVRQKRRLLLYLNGGILLAAAVFAIAYRVAAVHAPWLFDCAVRRAYHIYCPACGGSRAVMCLWRLDILGALRYYPPLVLCTLWLVELDVRLVSDLLLRTDRGMRTYRALWRWLTVPVLIALTWIVRIILLLGFRIDPLGDLLGAASL